MSKIISQLKIILENNDFGAMVNQPMRIIFNLKNGSKSPDISYSKHTPGTEERHIKIIRNISVNNEIISPETASDVIFLLKKMIFILIKNN